MYEVIYLVGLKWFIEGTYDSKPEAIEAAKEFEKLNDFNCFVFDKENKGIITY